MKIFSRYIFCSLLLCILACRQESSGSGIASAQSERLQGVYQQGMNNQLVWDCGTGKLVTLQDTPADELRQQCLLFDNPEGTVLWLDLQGEWKQEQDTIFRIHRILRIERHRKEDKCR